MKRFSKFFAVLLSIALLGGMLSTLAFAEDSGEVEAPSAKKNLVAPVEGIHNTIEYDFEDLHAGDSQFQSSKSSATAHSLYGWASNYNPSSLAKITVRTHSDVNEVTNNYLSFNITGDSSSSKAYWEFSIGKYSRDTTNKNNGNERVKNFSYIVVDFDFASDEYLYSLDGKNAHGATLPEGATDEKLAYQDGMGVYIIMRTGDNASLISYLQMYTVYIDGAWYLADSATHSSIKNKVPLFNIPGAWNHITMTVVTDPTNVANSMLRYYVNGQFLTEKAVNTNGSTYIMPDTVRFNVDYKKTTSSDIYHAFAIDNFTANYYPIGYTSGDAYGIDDYYANPEHKSISLSQCTDTVYTKEYTYIGTPTPYAAVLEHADGTTVNYYTLSTALENVQDGDYIVLNSSVFDYVPPTGVKKLTFFSESGMPFTVDPVVAQLYKIQNIGNVYTLILDEEKAMEIVWYDNQGEGREVIAKQNLPALATPNVEQEMLRIFGDLDFSNPENPTIDILRGWQWDIDNDGYADGVDVSALTRADINDLLEDGVNQISIVPVYETKALAFAIYEGLAAPGSGNFYAPDYDFEKFTSASNLVSAISAIEANKELTVVLYQDVTHKRASTISIKSGAIVNFDLNGHGLFQSESSKNSTNVRVFTLLEGAELSLYSSKAGAYVAQGVVDTDAKPASGEVAGVHGYGIISAADLDSCIINLGEKKNDAGDVVADGANLSLYGGTLINFAGSDKGAPNDKKITININGGSYYSVAAVSGGAMFPITEMDMIFNISDALLYTANGAAIFNSNSALAHSAIINAVDSTLIAGTANEDGTYTYTSCVASFSKNCSLKLEGCKVASITVDADKQIKLGAYNIIAEAKGVADKLDRNINIAFANKGIYSEDVTVTYTTELKGSALAADPLSIGSVDITLDYTNFTFESGAEFSELEAPFSSICEVLWLAPDGSLYDATYWLAGSVADAIEINFPTVENNNGWYDSIYSEWERVTDDDAEKKSFLISDGEYNAFYPLLNAVVENLDVGISIGLTDKLVFNVYLPEDDLLEVEFIGFFDKDGVQFAGSDAIKYTGAILDTDFVSDVIVAKFTVNGVLLEKEIVVDLFDYALEVDSEFGCGKNESRIVYAIMSYKYALVEDVIDSTSKLKLLDYFATHDSDCVCANVNYVEPSESIDYSDLRGLLLDISYEVSFDVEFGIQYSLTLSVRNDGSVTAVSAVIKDAALGDYTLAFVASNEGENIVYKCSDIPAEYFNKVVEITLNGNVFGTYSLAEYIKVNYSEVGKALYVICEEAYNAKLS